MLKEIFTSLPKVFDFAWRKKKNTQTKYNAADQVVDMQTVDFVLMKHN